MTYQDDPNNPNNVRRGNGMRDETSYTGWIIGGVVAYRRGDHALPREATTEQVSERQGIA